MVRRLGFKVISIDTSTAIRFDRAERQGLDFIEDHDSETEIKDLIWHADSILLDRGEVTLDLLKKFSQDTVVHWQKEKMMEDPMEANLWFGYIHVNSQLVVKRYYDQRDLDEANESQFVEKTFGPIQAEDRDMAIDLLKRALFN